MNFDIAPSGSSSAKTHHLYPGDPHAHAAATAPATSAAAATTPSAHPTADTPHPAAAASTTASAAPAAAPSAAASGTPDGRATTFQAVEGGAEARSGEALLVEAYSVLWVILLGWLVYLWRKQAGLGARLDDLERAIDRAAAKAEKAGKG
jgi:hypothetical protein